MNSPLKATDIPIGTKVKVNDFYIYFGTVKEHSASQDNYVLVEKYNSYSNKLEKVHLSKLEVLDPELELKFKATYESISNEMNSKIDMINNLLNDVVNLSEKHGIPFYSPVSQISQPYIPKSFRTKFNGLSPDVVYDLTGASCNYDDFGGWKHSSIC